MIPPSAYGLLGMAQVATNLIMILRDLGVGSAVIQRRAIDERLVSTVFWVNLGISLLCVAACWLAAPAAAVFFREPQVEPVLRALSAFDHRVSAIHLALLSRALRFRTIAMAEIAGAVAGLIAGVGFALSGTGVWALVASWLTNSAVSTVGLCLGAAWRPKAIFSWREIRRVARFSLHLTGFNVVNYFARNADAALIGRHLGNAALGYYQLAYTVMLLPVAGIAQQVVGRVLFPFAGMHDNDARFKAYLPNVRGHRSLTFPMMGSGSAGQPFVFVLSATGTCCCTILNRRSSGDDQSITTTIGQIYKIKN
jgi:PST family polysaccharide transporter